MKINNAHKTKMVYQNKKNGHVGEGADSAPTTKISLFSTQSPDAY